MPLQNTISQIIILATAPNVLRRHVNVFGLTEDVMKLSSGINVQSIVSLLNELVKRSTRYMFYELITKYTDIFVEKMREAFAMQASHSFSTKNIGVLEIKV